MDDSQPTTPPPAPEPVQISKPPTTTRELINAIAAEVLALNGLLARAEKAGIVCDLAVVDMSSHFRPERTPRIQVSGFRKVEYL